MTVRRALLVGINAYPQDPLRGCVNDVRQMHHTLKRYYRFREDDIHCLCDQQATLAAMRSGLEWLTGGGTDQDAVRVFHFSGHGHYIADTNGDEPDGRDECLCPYDFENAGYLSDDELKTHYDRMPQSSNLTLVMDCCYAGSIQKNSGEDIIFRFLPLSYEEQEQIDAAASRFADAQYAFVVSQLAELRTRGIGDEALQDHVPDLMSQFEKRRFGDIRVRDSNILLAGCRSDQQAADAPLSGDYYGAFTHFLTQTIADANGQIGHAELIRQVARELISSHFSQIPQLECQNQRDHLPAFQPFL